MRTFITNSIYWGHYFWHQLNIGLQIYLPIVETLRLWEKINHLQSQSSISSITKNVLCIKPAELKQKNFQIKVEQPSIFIIVKLNQWSIIFICGVGFPYSQDCGLSLVSKYLVLRKQRKKLSFFKIIGLKFDLCPFRWWYLWFYQ